MDDLIQHAHEIDLPQYQELGTNKNYMNETDFDTDLDAEEEPGRRVYNAGLRGCDQLGRASNEKLDAVLPRYSSPTHLGYPRHMKMYKHNAFYFGFPDSPRVRPRETRV